MSLLTLILAPIPKPMSVPIPQPILAPIAAPMNRDDAGQVTPLKQLMPLAPINPDILPIYTAITRYIANIVYSLGIFSKRSLYTLQFRRRRQPAPVSGTGEHE